MHRRLASLFLLSLAVTSFACREESRPAPARPEPPTSQAADDGLRPLTSRDGGTAPAAADTGATPQAAAPASLPPGHPPLSADSGAPSVAPGGPSVAGTVDVAPAHKAKIAGGALFLIARNAQTRQIVAVRRSESV